MRVGYHAYFRLWTTFFYKKCRASLSKHRQPSIRVRAKGIDAIRNHVCTVTGGVEEIKKNSDQVTKIMEH